MRKSQKVRLDRNVQDVVLPLLEELDTARSLHVAILLRYGEYGQLVKLKANPVDYATPNDFARAAAASDLLRKYPGLPTGIDLRAEAVKAFYDSERKCWATNRRLRDFTENCVVTDDRCPPEVHQVVDSMRQFCRVVLKGLPLTLVPRFGPGATVSDGSKLATVPDKLSSVPTMTSSFSCLLPVWGETAWARAHYRRQHSSTSPGVQIVRGNEFFTVPKDSSKDRGAAKGPSLNVAYQLPTGSFIRERLMEIGIDLEIGQQTHQRLAREGSVDGSLCTIDLSSASDTVAYQLVKLVLPSLWFELLETLREPFTKVDGKWVLLEKYSAMGNGFTFELETLVFLAIVHAAARLHGDDGFDLVNNREVAVYGDDIIVPKRISATVVSLLKFFGFTPNEGKTFLDGAFRESCGGDFYSGYEVTPLKLDHEITEPHQWIAFANGIGRLAARLNRVAGCSVDFGRSRARCLANLPSHIRRLTGPSWLGDLVIHEDSDAWVDRLEPLSHGARGLRVWAPVRHVVEWKHFYHDVVLASALYGTPSAGASPRGVSGYREKRLVAATFAWHDSSQGTSAIQRVINRVTGCNKVLSLRDWWKLMKSNDLAPHWFEQLVAN